MGIPHTLIKFCLPKTVKMAGYSTMAIVTRQSRFWKKCFFWCILFSDKFVARNQWVWCESFQRWIPNPTIWHLDFVSVVDFLTYLYIQYSKQVILLFKKTEYIISNVCTWRLLKFLWGKTLSKKMFNTKHLLHNTQLWQTTSDACGWGINRFKDWPFYVEATRSAVGGLSGCPTWSWNSVWERIGCWLNQ